MKCTADPAQLCSTQQSGVIFMNCTIDMPSYTYAIPGQRLLRARGFPCTVKRRGKDSRSGCGFSVVLRGNCESAAKLLDMYDIPYSISNGGDEGDDKL